MEDFGDSELDVLLSIMENENNNITLWKDVCESQTRIEDPLQLCLKPDIATVPSNTASTSEVTDLLIKMRQMEDELSRLKQQLKQKNNDTLEVTNELAPTKIAAGTLRPIDLNLTAPVNNSKQRTPLPQKNETDTTKARASEVHTGDTDSSDEEANRDPINKKYNEFGSFVKKRLAHTPRSSDVEKRDKSTWKKTIPLQGTSRAKPLNDIKPDEKVEIDEFSGIRMINPLVSSIEMRNRMEGRRLIKMGMLRSQMRGGDIEGDWVTIGVLVSKGNPKKSSKGNSFSVWKMCDLRDCNKIVSLFLFGKCHETHWKSCVGSVFGLLNPSVMPNRDTTYKKSANEICLTVDHPQKIMLMGTSKDFGTCKGRRKDGSACTAFVNKADCEFCEYHIQAEYRQSSAKRSELHASYSGREPTGLRAKILGKQNVMYGGQVYVGAPRSLQEKTKALKTKDQFRLDSLKLQKKASEMMKEELAAATAKASTLENENKICEQNDGLRSNDSSPGGHSAGNNPKTVAPQQPIKSVTPSELLKMHELEMKFKKRQISPLVQLRDEGKNAPFPQIDSKIQPKLGKGLLPGGHLLLDPVKEGPSMSKAKLKALWTITQSKASLVKADPNAVKKCRTSSEFQEKVKKRLMPDVEDEGNTSEPSSKKGRTDEMDVSSEEFLQMLNKKSKYDHVLQADDLERQEYYFNALEKKEKIEEKMSTTMEVPCKAVSCKKCKYTAFAALQTCREASHPLMFHKAVKRFFKCNQCKRRTVSLNKLPTKPCSGCGGSDYQRVAMWQEKAGPMLESERLLLRGDEIKNVNHVYASQISLSF